MKISVYLILIYLLQHVDFIDAAAVPSNVPMIIETLFPGNNKGQLANNVGAYLRKKKSKTDPTSSSTYPSVKLSSSSSYSSRITKTSTAKTSASSSSPTHLKQSSTTFSRSTKSLSSSLLDLSTYTNWKSSISMSSGQRSPSTVSSNPISTRSQVATVSHVIASTPISYPSSTASLAITNPTSIVQLSSPSESQTDSQRISTLGLISSRSLITPVLVPTESVGNIPSAESLSRAGSETRSATKTSVNSASTTGISDYTEVILDNSMTDTLLESISVGIQSSSPYSTTIQTCFDVTTTSVSSGYLSTGRYSEEDEASSWEVTSSASTQASVTSNLVIETTETTTAQVHSETMELENPSISSSDRVADSSLQTTTICSENEMASITLSTVDSSTQDAPALTEIFSSPMESTVPRTTEIAFLDTSKLPTTNSESLDDEWTSTSLWKTSLADTVQDTSTPLSIVSDPSESFTSGTDFETSDLLATLSTTTISSKSLGNHSVSGEARSLTSNSTVSEQVFITTTTTSDGMVSSSSGESAKVTSSVDMFTSTDMSTAENIASWPTSESESAVEGGASDSMTALPTSEQVSSTDRSTGIPLDRSFTETTPDTTNESIQGRTSEGLISTSVEFSVSGVGDYSSIFSAIQSSNEILETQTSTGDIYISSEVSSVTFGTAETSDSMTVESATSAVTDVPTDTVDVVTSDLSTTRTDETVFSLDIESSVSTVTESASNEIETTITASESTGALFSLTMSIQEGTLDDISYEQSLDLVTGSFKVSFDEGVATTGTFGVTNLMSTESHDEASRSDLITSNEFTVRTELTSLSTSRSTLAVSSSPVSLLIASVTSASSIKQTSIDASKIKTKETAPTQTSTKGPSANSPGTKEQRQNEATRGYSQAPITILLISLLQILFI